MDTSSAYKYSDFFPTKKEKRPEPELNLLKSLHQVNVFFLENKRKNNTFFN